MRKMLVYSDMNALPVAKRQTAYAEAYRRAAETICSEMMQDAGAYTWPTASVVLMLSAHAVEIFLKGAIHHRDPTAHFGSHDIAYLEREYRSRFPEASFELDVLFKVEAFGATEEELKELKSMVPPPSILYRYPVKKGREYEAALGFAPESMLLALQALQADFRRIDMQLV